MGELQELEGDGMNQDKKLRMFYVFAVAILVCTAIEIFDLVVRLW